MLPREQGVADGYPWKKGTLPVRDKAAYRGSRYFTQTQTILRHLRPIKKGVIYPYGKKGITCAAYAGQEVRKDEERVSRRGSE